MRSIGTLAVGTGMLLLASGCSDGAGSSPPDNAAPVADFAVPPCIINVACPFASTSTDDARVTDWSWDFDGDGTPDASAASTSYKYTSAGAFSVSLTVRDAQGLSDTKTSTITIGPVVPPTAGFTHTCNATDCTFTSTSTNGSPGTITTYGWTFGDGGTGDGNNPSHSYTVTASTDFTVTLTVTDNQGASDVETQTVTVVPTNTSPTADFKPWCEAADCLFISTSTDLAPGTITSYAWTFGDGATADWNQPSHTYSVTTRTTFTVTLAVTDNQGATAVATKTISVFPSPPAVEGCVTSGKDVNCAFTVTSRSTVKLKLLGISCVDRGQRVTTPPPVGDQVFLSVCWGTVGQELGIFGGRLDELIVYEAGTQVRIRFTQGIPLANEPAVAPPAAHWVGSYPDWTVNFEDGANPGAAGEPDFTDVVLGVHAVQVP